MTDFLVDRLLENRRKADELRRDLEAVEDEARRIQEELRRMEAAQARRGLRVEDHKERAVTTVKRKAGQPVRTSEVAAELGISGAYASVVLGLALADGQVERVRNGVYRAPAGAGGARSNVLEYPQERRRG